MSGALRALACRCLCKAFELVLRATTGLRRLGTSDPTLILLETFTPAQAAAAAALAQRSARPAPLQVPAKLLVLVPFRDRWPLTLAAIESLLTQSLSQVTIRLALLNNGSTEDETRRGLLTLGKRLLPKGFELAVHDLPMPFNYSKINNVGRQAEQAFAADYLLFLNNDVEFQRPGDLEQLLEFARVCPDLGALGCTLDYPDGSLQHLFAAPGVKIVAAHPLRRRIVPSSAKWFAEPRPVAAVTGAVMLVRAANFDRVGGFDEALPSVGQDIDLCLKLQTSSLVNWVLPAVRLIHKEGGSRPGAIDKAQVAYMYEKWGDQLRHNAWYSDRLTRFSEAPVYRLIEPNYPWAWVLS